MMPNPDSDVLGYSTAAAQYWAAGWRGILPLRRGFKKTPPPGFTGKTGNFPSYPDILSWADLYPDGNLCLRLPDGIIGIDVDGYGAKTGADTIIEAELRWGALPDTVRSTSRNDDPLSGIRLYRVPPNLTFTENIAFDDRGIGDIEIIQRKHRYVLAWPSLHPEGRTYHWYDPHGNPTDIPNPNQLPQLPAAWIEQLKEQPEENLNLGGQRFHTPDALTGGEPAALVAERLRQAIKELNLPGQSRHITCRGHVLALLRLGKTGQSGVKQALTLLGETFIAFVAKDRPGGKDEARREYRAMVLGPGAARELAKPGITSWTTNITVTEPPPPNTPKDTPPADPHPIWGYHPPINGHQFLFQQPDTLRAWWGENDEILWMDGEAFMIAGGMGLGKTTLAGQILKAQLCGGLVLQLPVAPVDGNILYLAMDRPRQIARSLRRQFDITDQDALQRLHVRPGPPPVDLAADPARLCRMADEIDATIIYIDSLKDAAIPLSKDEIGAAYNRARQFTLNHDRQICELHHNRKSTRDTSPGSINEVYGSVWLAAGCGSIVNLVGEPGDPIIDFRHIKQPLDEVGPFRLLNNTATGVIEIEHEADLLALADAAGADGLTAIGAAAALFGVEKPTRAQKEKARRRLEKLTLQGILKRIDGSPGGSAGGESTVWFRGSDTDWTHHV